MNIKRYRLIEYDGDDRRVEEILQRSLDGTYPTARCIVTAVEIHESAVTEAQQEALDSQKSIVTGWPGQQQGAEGLTLRGGTRAN